MALNDNNPDNPEDVVDFMPRISPEEDAENARLHGLAQEELLKSITSLPKDHKLKAQWPRPKTIPLNYSINLDIALGLSTLFTQVELMLFVQFPPHRQVDVIKDCLFLTTDKLRGLYELDQKVDIKSFLNDENRTGPIAMIMNYCQMSQLPIDKDCMVETYIQLLEIRSQVQDLPSNTEQ